MAVVIVAGLAFVHWMVGVVRGRRERKELRAAIGRIEKALADYADCALEGGALHADWLAGVDLASRAQGCEAPYRKAVAGHPSLDIGQIDRRGKEEPEDAARICRTVLERRVALDKLRTRAELQPGPGRACDARVEEYGVSYADRNTWLRTTQWTIRGDTLITVGEHDNVRGGRGWPELSAYVGPVERNLWLFPGAGWMDWGLSGPWVVADELSHRMRVYFSNGGPLIKGDAVFPTFAKVLRMRESPGVRTIVGWRREAMVVVRVDPDARRVVGTMSLGELPGGALMQISAAGAVTALSREALGNVLLHLPAGATKAKRTRLDVGGAPIELCGEDEHVIAHVGTAVYHSADGGATFAPLGELPDMQQDDTVCGPGWHAELDAGRRDYTLCRAGRCTTSAFTPRRFRHLALARYRGGVRALLQLNDYAVVLQDEQLTGTLRMHGVWRVESHHAFLFVDGSWFPLSEIRAHTDSTDSPVGVDSRQQRHH